jgi:polyisoprenoid-binding protein YceI
MRTAALERQPAPRKSRPRPEVWHAGPRESEIRFSLRHLILAKLSGRISRWRASFVIDLDQPSRSAIEVVVDAGSLDTGAPERDDLTRSAAFLDIGRFPEIRFRSREVRPRGDRRLLITGDLTIRDVTRDVEVEVERTPTVAVRSHVSKLVFKGHTSISRQDFRLRWPSELDRGGGLRTGDNIDIDFKLNARRGAK